MPEAPIVVSAGPNRPLLELWPLNGAPSDAIVEDAAYKYRFSGSEPIQLIEPSELFECDPDDTRTGRFRPRNHVGIINVVVFTTANYEVCFEVEVRPAKLESESHYRAMLEQVADRAAEALLQGYAPAILSVNVDSATTGELRYRALAFLTARLRDTDFLAAMEQVIRSPHRQWITTSERRSISHGLPTGSIAARQLSRPGPRIERPGHLSHLPRQGLPHHTEWRRNIVTYDTPPNRFVRHAFETWRNLAQEVLATFALPTSLGAGPRRRGIRDAQWLEHHCSQMLSHPVLAEASPMTSMPLGDPVLLRQSGYREILRVFALAQASIGLDAELPDDTFSATQRNVATLYEYWCFLVLLDCIERIADSKSDAVVFEPNQAGMSLVLRHGQQHRHSWFIELRGRRLQVDLWFNHNFKRHDSSQADASSWASSMRPDASLRIRPRSARPSSAVDPDLDVWLHFDAKYRVQRQDIEFSDDPADTATRSDLLKMHSYRDAIRRSAGAYVLYPGDGPALHHEEFHELLPGIGAFPLRPGREGSALGLELLEQFLRDVLRQAANQASSAERSRYWNAQHTQAPGRQVRPSERLRTPPADAKVLIGYVRSAQWPWVRSTRQYNVRADGRLGAVAVTDDMLTAGLMVLWTGSSNAPQLLGLFERVGSWQVANSEDLRATGYPVRNTSAMYLVCEINAASSSLDQSFDERRLSALVTPDYRPVATTWDLMSAV
jgi:hypothetical protein